MIHVGRTGDCKIKADAIAPTREIAQDPVLYNESTRILQLMAGAHMFADQIELAQQYDAILFHGTGLGHLPIEDPNQDSPENVAMREAIGNYCSQGGIAVMTTQCVHGPVHMDVYSKGREQQELGILGNHATLGPDAALIKLHFLLSSGQDISTGWDANLCGENHSSISN